MASETQPSWPTARLGDLAEKVRSGATPKGGQISYLVERQGHALIRSQNVLDHEFDSEGLAFISEAQAADLRGAEVASDDVLLNITGDGRTFGRACVVPSAVLPACVNQHVMLVRVDRSRLHPHFLASWLALSETKEYIESFNAGGSRRAITKGHIERFEVPLPPFAVQEAIGSLAAVINRRVESLRQTNATLEAIAQALFKSWFVDFDPVRAKADGREPEGMDAATAALFPSEFEASELGLIPRGWTIARLDEHVEAERGLSYKGAGLADQESGLPMHNLNSVLEGGGYKYAGIKFYKGDFKERHIAQAGDVVVANTEQGHHHRLIGFPAIVPRKFQRGLFSHHLYRVRIRDDSPITRHWIYRALMAPRVRDQIAGCANGSTVNMLKPAGLQIPRFVLPPGPLCEKFEGLAVALHDRMETNVDLADSLAALRDTLLPRLISGKLRLPEAEKLIEEAVA